MILAELAAELSDLYGSIKEPVKRSSRELIDELDFRSQWLARSAELLAEAQYILDQKRGIESEKLLARDLPPSVLKTVLEASCADERKILTQAERLNATLTHQIDAIRSILSFEKESAKLAR